MLIGFLLHVLVELDPPRFNDGALGETENVLLVLGFYIERLKYRRRCGCSYTCLDERSTFHFFWGWGDLGFVFLAYLAFCPANRGTRAKSTKNKFSTANAREYTRTDRRKKIEVHGYAQIWRTTPRKTISEVYLRTSALICGWPYFFVFALIRVHSWLVRFLRVLCVFVVKFVPIEDFAAPHRGAIHRDSLSWYELEAA